MVTPFKALNISSRSFVTDDGSEIGVGQALQAWACDIVPNGRMNPILVKATPEGLITIANGAAKGKIKGRDALLRHALRTYDELTDRYDAVVAEGSGSPAEINLRNTDIANVNFAAARNIPMILIGDIEKGGVFAGLYGTWRLIDDAHKHLLKGFIINKYYGDTDILKSGIERIETLTGMKCLGVLPYMRAELPEEDSSEGRISFENKDIDAYVETLDSMLEKAAKNIDLNAIEKIMTD
jgi:adenosylcobyric acid synthase